MNFSKLILNDLYDVILPDGFIGRPWDNVYELKTIVSDDFYNFKFSGVRFELSKKNQFIFLKNSLLILINNNSKVFIGYETVLNNKVLEKKYDSGIIAFLNTKDEKFRNNFLEIISEINSIEIIS